MLLLIFIIFIAVPAVICPEDHFRKIATSRDAALFCRYWIHGLFTGYLLETIVPTDRIVIHHRLDCVFFHLLWQRLQRTPNFSFCTVVYIVRFATNCLASVSIIAFIP